MVHRILHVGDVHLDSRDPRNSDRLAALDRIIAHASSCDGLAAILIPGDLFHQKPTTADRNDLAERIIALAKHAPLALCYGNHDEPESLDIFSRLDTKWPVYVINRPQVLVLTTATKFQLAVFVLPYPFKAAMVGAGVQHQELGQTTRELFEPIFMSAADELERAARGGLLTMMAGHISICGATSSTGQPQVGTALEIDGAQLARLGHIPKCLAHIHKHQEIDGAVYAGSIARLDFGEREDKGFVEWAYDEVEARWSWQFISLHVPAMFHVEGRLTRDSFILEAVDGQKPGGVIDTAGADVRVRFRFLKAEAGAIDPTLIRRLFADARSIKLDPIPELEHQVRAPEIAAATTLEQKVKVYAATRGIPWTPAMEQKLAALQAQDEQALIAAITQSLALLTTPAPEHAEVA